MQHVIGYINGEFQQYIETFNIWMVIRKKHIITMQASCMVYLRSQTAHILSSDLQVRYLSISERLWSEVIGVLYFVWSQLINGRWSIGRVLAGCGLFYKPWVSVVWRV